jgi:hypothetical protein
MLVQLSCEVTFAPSRFVASQFSEADPSDRLEAPEFTPPPRKVQGGGPPDSVAYSQFSALIATLAMVLVLPDWLLNTAQP